MKSNLFPFIIRANQVMFFIGVILLAGFIALNLLRDIFAGSYTIQQVKIIDEKSMEGSDLTVEYSKVHSGMIKDTHIIELRSRVIDPSTSHEGVWEAKSYKTKLNYFSGGEADRANVVNILFVNSNNEKRMLFESDRLIESSIYAKFDESSYSSYKSSKNIYSVVSSDTNNNGYLDVNDNRDLYISEYNGVTNKLIVANINSYNLLADDALLVTLGNKKDRQFFEYAIKTGKLIKLDTEIVTK